MNIHPQFSLVKRLIKNISIVTYTIACTAISTASAKESLPVSDNNTKQPNILLIITDDQSIDTINALGNDAIHTPNLDRLAHAGMAFTHVFNQGSWSGAVCAPSRQMINTGRNLHFTGFSPKSNKTTHPLMGETFRKSGYETFITGKWHVGEDALQRSFDIGRAVHEKGMPHLNKGGQWKPWLTDFGEQIKWKTKQVNQHTSEAFADAAIDYIDNKGERNKKPFMMYVAFTAPHDPRQSPQSYVDKYPAENIALPPNFVPMPEIDAGDYNIRDEALMTFPRTEKQTKEFIGEYYAMIEHMDHQIGRILDTLDASPYADNTYIIFTSDHGLAVGKHGLAGKQSVYDHSIRAPFIMTGKGIPANSQAKGMFYLNSIFATTAELAGIEVPESVQGPSILPIIRGEKEVMNDYIYGSYRHFQRMARSNRYKLVYYPLLKRNVLFDLKNDPWEMNDISEQEGSDEIIKQLTAKLEELKIEVGDTLTNDDPENSYQPFTGKVRAGFQKDHIGIKQTVFTDH
ncbi:sulfatase-like hydrolase/transferase [Thalassotalea crassostreae]|uniref:sulfatase-like hydrolase/transferase n=1 Tax=Thalassotalea crassostreae TaxID=1763536 RepID=UPI00083975B0|nr:sulfatase-like hydrolase/transferase [Thalassotalea crassostreae]